MSYQVLARKWRPRQFADVVGQGHVVRALSNALDGGRLHHAFLFTGTRGVGKTTIARIVAKCLNCEVGVSATPCGECPACREIDEGRFVDLIEVDAASRTKVDDTRDLLDNVPYAPTRGRYKVYLIDEVHMFSKHSFNALLKTLEEPPPHVKFLLATTDPQKLPVTVLSRCLQFNLRGLAEEQLAGQLQAITGREGVTAEPGALRLLAKAAAGSVRDALSLLDQAIAYGDGALREADARDMLGTIDRGQVFRLLATVAAGDGPGVLAGLQGLAEQVADFDALLAEAAAVLQRVAVAQVVPGALDPEDPDTPEVETLATAMGPEDVQLYYQIALMGRRDLPLAPDPRTGCEMTLLRMLAFRPGDDGDPLPGPAPQAKGQGQDPAVTAPAARPHSPPPTRAAAARQPRATASAQGETVGEPQDWHALVASLPLGGLAREMAANSVLEAWGEDTLSLTLDGAHAHLRNPSREGQLATALGQRLGHPVTLRITVGEPTAETPAARQRRVADERRAAAVRAIAEDPNVRNLQETFNARVLEETVRPRD